MYSFSRCRWRLVSALIALLTLGIATPAIGQVASVQPTWPVAVKQTSPGGLLTNKQGAVTVSSCSTWGQYTHQFETYSPDGSLKHSIPNSPQNYGFCDGTWSVGSDGTQYMQYRTASGSPWQIRAIRGSVVLWTVSLPHTCGANPSVLLSLSIGANNVVYALSGEVACTSKSAHLTYINGSTGAILRDVFIGTPGSFCCFNVSNLAPYSNGVAVWTNNSIYYYNSSGTMVRSHYLIADGSQIVASHVGRIFLSTLTSNGRCTGGIQSTQVRGYQPIGNVAKAYTFSTPCIRVLSITPMPDGALVRVRFDAETVKLLRLDANLAYKWLLPLPTETGSRRDGTDLVHLSVDTQGNILTVQNVVSANNRYGVVAHLLDGNTGVVRAAYNSLAVSSSRLRLLSTANVARSQGKLYLGLRSCVYDAYNLCWSSNGDYLYQINFAEMGMDYPRGTLLGAPNPSGARKYAALGDSYSSGEGVPSFEADTNTPGPPENPCHRSTRAYARALDVEPAVGLNLSRFVACSGATAKNIFQSSWYSESKQVDRLDIDTKIVTITIGGNDVEFNRIANICNKNVDPQDCVDQLKRSLKIAHSSAFMNDLDAAYAAIHAKAPAANIYTFTYPFFLNDPDYSQPVCGWTIRQMSLTEKELVDSVTSVLNEDIRQVARKYGVNVIETKEAFQGHEICAQEPYVNGIDLFNKEYSYHPNLTGQGVMGDLAVAAIS